jgi:DNA-binding response OmpR family regulator
MTKKVMVVDDEKDIVDIVASFLEGEGFEVQSALGGKECIESIGDINPDILLMDVMMPDMNGWDAIRELKSMGVLGKVKVIMLTVVKEPKQEYADLSPYVLDYITKPFNKKDLLKRVTRLSEL